MFLQNIRHIIGDITSLATLLDVLSLPETELFVINYYVQQLACPTPGAVPDILQEILDSLFNSSLDLNLLTLFGGNTDLVNNFFCDADIVQTLVQITRYFINDWYEATEHGGVCT